DGQGFGGRQFDLVIAANVLHATLDLRQTLRHVRQLLAPGGLLLLLENTARSAWVDVIWGLTPGWWRFADHDLRPAYPLLSESQWHGLLEESGFAAVEGLAADPGRHPALSRQALLMARNAATGPAGPGGEGGAWLILADEEGLGGRLASLLAARGFRPVLA